MKKPKKPTPPVLTAELEMAARIAHSEHGNCLILHIHNDDSGHIGIIPMTPAQ